MTVAFGGICEYAPGLGFTQTLTGLPKPFSSVTGILTDFIRKRLGATANIQMDGDVAELLERPKSCCGDGKKVVSASVDKTVRIWSACASRSTIIALTKHRRGS